MLEAIRATERAIACQTESERRSDVPSRTGAVIGILSLGSDLSGV
jgi:hypothetical protein